MKKITLVLILITSILIINPLSFAGLFSDSDKDYKIEDAPGMILNKKYVSTKYNISILYPSSWDIVDNITGKYSVVKIRSEHGSGLENINITVIPLDNKKEYTIDDFRDGETPEMLTLLDSGDLKVGSEQAIWKKMYMETSGIKSNKQMKEMLSAPSFMYRESEKNAISYQVQVVRNNHLYTISCAALDSTKGLALQRFDNYKDLFTEMVSSFGFEKGWFYSPEHNLRIGIPDGWSKFSSRQGILASYGKLGSGENFMIRVNTVPSSTRVESLTWQELFYPQYDGLSLEEEDSIEVDGKSFKYCVYEITDKRLKQQQEGKYDLKYMAVAFMSGSKLYLITFTDGVDNFKNNYSLFMDTIKSIRFVEKG